MKLTNSSTMASTHKYQIPLQNLSIQATHAEIFPYLHSSLISIGQLCDNECIVTFDKHKVIVSKNKDIIIEGYRDPTNGLWRLPHSFPAQYNKQANILEPQLCIHSNYVPPPATIPRQDGYLQYFLIITSNLL